MKTQKWRLKKKEAQSMCWNSWLFLYARGIRRAGVSRWSGNISYVLLRRSKAALPFPTGSNWVFLRAGGKSEFWDGGVKALAHAILTKPFMCVTHINRFMKEIPRLSERKLSWKELGLAEKLLKRYILWSGEGLRGSICQPTRTCITSLQLCAVHALTCGKESGLLELCVGQRLLVVQNTGVEQGARSVVLLKCRSLW